VVTVRPADPADRQRIRECHVAAIRAFGPDAYDDRQVAAWADKGDPEDYYPVGQEGHYFVVAERPVVDEAAADGDAEVVGYGHLVPTEREIRAVYVHPGAAGDGVGTALLDALESRARDLDLDALTLHASLNAAGFYEHAGYERAGRETYSTVYGGETVELDIVRMEKQL
jgi:putative acetyltransferase